MSIDFGSYHFQVGGHGLSDETGLVTLFEGNAICKPLGVDNRAIVESLIYRDIFIALLTGGNILPQLQQSQTHIPTSTTLTSYKSSISTQQSGQSMTIHSGWLSIDTISAWKSAFLTHSYQFPFYAQFNQFISQPNPSSVLHSTVLNSNAYRFLQQFKLPITPINSPFISLPISPLSSLTKQQQLYFLWYFRSLYAKSHLFPTPLGFIVKEFTNIEAASTSKEAIPSASKSTLNEPNSIFQKPYCALESLTVRYNYPAIIDLKMGQVSWDLHAKYDKMSYELIKYPIQSNLGFRIVGAQIPIVYSKPHLQPQLQSILSNNSNSIPTSLTSSTLPVSQCTHDNNINPLSSTNHICELVTRLKYDRKQGQAVLSRESLAEILMQLFLSLLLPIKKPSFYTEYSDVDYNILCVERYSIVHDLITFTLHQLQVVLLLFTLYPTHHSVASSVLISFEADPIPCIQLIKDWKKWTLQQYIGLFYNHSLLQLIQTNNLFSSLLSNFIHIDTIDIDVFISTLSNTHWDFIISTMHEKLLETILHQYEADNQWVHHIEQSLFSSSSITFTSTPPAPKQCDFSAFNYQHLNPSSQTASFSHTQLTLPVTLKLIDFAHAFNDIDYRTDFEAWKVKQCCPSQTKYILPDFSPKKRLHVDLALEDSTWTHLGATIERYRFIADGLGRKDILSMEQLVGSGILTCSDCSIKTEAALPSFLPNVYQSNPLTSEEDTFGAVEVDWHFLHLCPIHHCYSVHPSIIQQFQQNKSLHQDTCSVLPVIDLLPQSIQHNPLFTKALAASSTCSPSSPLHQFSADHMFLNGIKSLIAYLLYIQRHHLIEHRRDAELI